MSRKPNVFLYPVFLSVLLLVLSVSPIVFAVEGIGDIDNISLEDLLNTEITVASKSKESLNDAPSSVSVFTADEIRNMGITHIQELLNYVPGFQATRDIEQGTASRVSARGRSTALSESVLFLVDGQRINDLYTGGISIINRLIPVENIKQVEIIRGPGSALYGSNAFLGVVNIVTLDNANNINVQTGSQDSKSIAVNLSKTFSPSFSAAAFLKTFRDDGYTFKTVEDIYGTIGETRDPVKGTDAYLTLKFKKFTLNARYLDRTLADFLTFGNLANRSNREETTQGSISLGYEGAYKKLEFKLGARYVFDRWNTLSQLIPAGFELAPGFALSEPFIGGPYLESYLIGANADFTFKFSRSNTLSAGVSFIKTGIERVENRMTHHPITLDYQGPVTIFSGDLSFNREETRYILGIYVQDKHKFSKRLSLTAGIRFDRYNDFGSSINPRAALIYNVPWDATIKLMYGSAFRAPNFLELYDKNNPVDFGNEDLEPEKVQTIEAAYIQKIKSLNAQLAVTFFYNKIKDLIILGDPVVHPENPQGAPRFQNAGELETKGLELELKAVPSRGFTIIASFTRFFDGEDLLVSPNSGSLILNFGHKGYNFNINGIFRDKIAVIPGQGSYALINAAIMVPVNQYLKLSASIKNIFDEDYRTVTLVLPGGVPNRGRTFSLGLIIEDFMK